MTDRDRFAAAALTGLLANNCAHYAEDIDEPAGDAYAYADAMLRQRKRTNHDAAPAARCKDGHRCGSCPADDGQAAGNLQEPVAWAVWCDKLEPTLCVMRGDAKSLADECNAGMEPLYRSPTLTGQEREAIAVAIFECESMPTATSREAATALRLLLARTK